ncbi:MAG: phenylalanine--tRNA ligase subunit beta [candidate division WOR-3 bacterium]|nr:MAG: phenylalanine--tRNA ligase subunit beta [candidate division WOR-3 bacterium]
MLFSIKWLEEFLGTKLDVDTLEKVCLDLGLEVEERINYAPRDITIGKIISISPHPRQKNLDFLNVKAKRSINIVTAAKNIRKGDLVLVATAGSKLNDNPVAEKNFAGVKSEGVLVSEQELGLAESSTGVIVLDRGRPGAAFSSYFDDLVVDMSATPNRPDWLSLEGIAREISGSLGIDYSKLSSLDRMYAPVQNNRSGNFKIKIEDINGCPRYTGRLFHNVKVAESPFWMKWRLHCMGMNAINNIVDTTNLIMLLTGQPLHPFDADLLKGGIFIRNARAGERFVTLDGTILKLAGDDLVIADREAPVALAGIIGAKRAQISRATTKVLLESAYFHPKRIGHTARRLGIMTDASTRFERGGDIAIVDAASSMAGTLFKEQTGCTEIEFIGQGKKLKPIKVRFSLTRLNEILSLELTSKQVKNILKKINIHVTGAKSLTAKIPHYRRDIHIEEDLYEEVARVYGYMRIPETEPKKWSGHAQINRTYVHEETVRNYLVGQGFDETYNLSLMSGKVLAQAGYEHFVSIKNPLNERFDALRPTLLFGLLDTLNYNLSKGNKSLRLFELGNVLLSKPPYQERRVGVIMGGDRNRDFWQQGEDTLNYFDAKGVVESVFEILRVSDVSFKPLSREGFKQSVAIHVSGKELGFLASLDTELCKEPYYFFELALEPLWNAIEDAFYMPPPRFPANTRDLSFVTEDKVQVPDMVSAISRVGGPILERVVLFDYYKGENLSPMKKSLGFRLHFRAPDRTLTDREVDVFVKRITEEVLKTFNASLRTKE